ncbi:MAG: hypothetical protein ACR2RV_08805 [Verrucomicrobiales bacterium]
MRLLFALVFFHAFPRQVPFTGAKYEVGIARVMPLTWLGDPGTLDACRWVLVVALCVYASGRLLVLALPVIAFLTIAPATLANSQGAFHHHLQVLGLVVLVQWIWFSYRAIAAGEYFRPGRRTQVLNVFYSQQVIVATYLTTAVWKLWKTNFGWIRESKYFPVQLVKTRDAHYYNKLEHASAEPSGWAGGVDAWFAKMIPHLETFLFAHPNFCRLIIGSGLLLELFAFIALIGRGSRLLYGGLLIAFHLIIGRVMNLNFEYNIFLVLIFFVNLPWLVVVIWGKLKSAASGGDGR